MVQPNKKKQAIFIPLQILQIDFFFQIHTYTPTPWATNCRPKPVRNSALQRQERVLQARRENCRPSQDHSDQRLDMKQLNVLKRES